jgi:hypothetical protein
MGGQPVKKILVRARGISTLQVEVKFSVFLLSFLVGLRCKPVFTVDAVHRLPIWIIQKNLDWR